ncbi:hypothetical protein B0A55_02834 [Friedmanniomyces simplex]|uniref:Uncharacterized protein n=1 Tax=Friedmanniomyces simplex TaxID=329884 RepID=A0A4U0XS08_9PEZI|nr:hypothetical protein B0A55_02834 [Friedmanniomyces simplex]
MLENYISETAKNLGETRDLLKQYGDTLAERWSKYHPRKRADILRKAIPDIYSSKWLEAYCLFDEESDRVAAVHRPHLRYKWRKGWLLPYINVETMSQDEKKLLLLLFVRTNNEPQEFLAYDFERTKMAFKDHHVTIMYNHHCVLMCEEAGRVGELTPWNGDRVHRGDIVGFPRAQLAFEVACGLSVFLRGVAKIVLAKGPGDDEPRGCVNLDAIAAKSLAGTSGGRPFFNERPFSEPQQSDISLLKPLLQSMRQSACDELWLMQTDPLYFHDKLANFEPSLYYRKSSEEGKIEDLPRSVFDIVGRIELALVVERRSTPCLDTIEKLSGSVKRGQPLPQMYDEALGRLQSTLKEYYSSYLCSLQDLTIQMPDFQDYFHWVADNGFRLKPLTDDVFRKDRLFWNTHKLITSANELNPSQDQSFHLQYIDDLLLSSPKESNRIDQGLYDHFSHMLAIDEARNVVASHLPHGSGLGRDLENDRLNVPGDMIDSLT